MKRFQFESRFEMKGNGVHVTYGSVEAGLVGAAGGEHGVSLVKTQQLEVAVMLHFGRSELRPGGSRRRGSGV